MPDESSSSSESCAVALDVFRINGTRVPDADKAHEGSIVNIYNPYRVDYEELPDPPNNRIDIELSWSGDMPIGSVATLEEHGPSLGKGTIVIYDGNVLVKPARASWVVINLAAYTDPKRFQVEAYLTGVTNLKFVIREYAGGPVVGLCEDDVRISGISDLPKDGRIVFVNPQAAAHSTPYDDYETNAASTVKAAVVQLQADDNIVIAPLRFPEIDLILDKSCVIAGISGYFDPGIELTKYNLSGATVLDANQQGRIFEISTDTVDTDSITITGLQANNGEATHGGALLSEEDADSSLRLSYCRFEGNGAVDVDSGGASLRLNGGATLAAFSPTTRQLGLGLAAVPRGNRELIASGELRFEGGGGVHWRKRLKGTVGGEGKMFNAVSCDWEDNIGHFGGAIGIFRNPDPDTTVKRRLLQSELKRRAKREFTPVMKKIETFVRQCKFVGNRAIVQGGAIVSRRRRIKSIFASSFPKLIMTGGAPIKVTGCSFKNNKVKFDLLFGINLSATPASPPAGGAIHLEGINCSGSIIEGSDFKENSSAKDGGAVSAIFMATLTIRPWVRGKLSQKSTFVKNHADDGGGAIYCTYFAVARLIETDIIGNTADGGAGGVHATSGCVFDVVECRVVGNIGRWGGGFHNRNSRMDLRKTTVAKNESKKDGGGVVVICQDDSGGKTHYYLWPKSFWLFPEPAVCPTLLFVSHKSSIQANKAKTAGGGIMIRRWENRKEGDRYIDVADKILMLFMSNSEVVDNTVTNHDDRFDGAAAGLAMQSTWESRANVPNFDRKLFTDNLVKAFREYYPPFGVRWPDGGKFSNISAALYIVDNMTWGLTRRGGSRDSIADCIFKGNKGAVGDDKKKVYQAAVRDHLDVKTGNGGLQTGGNTVGRREFQRPAGLLTKPLPPNPAP